MLNVQVVLQWGIVVQRDNSHSHAGWGDSTHVVLHDMGHMGGGNSSPSTDRHVSGEDTTAKYALFH